MSSASAGPSQWPWHASAHAVVIMALQAGARGDGGRSRAAARGGLEAPQQGGRQQRGDGGRGGGSGSGSGQASRASYSEVAVDGCVGGCQFARVGKPVPSGRGSGGSANHSSSTAASSCRQGGLALGTRLRQCRWSPPSSRSRAAAAAASRPALQDLPEDAVPKLHLRAEQAGRDAAFAAAASLGRPRRMLQLALLLLTRRREEERLHGAHGPRLLAAGATRPSLVRRQRRRPFADDLVARRHGVARCSCQRV